VVLVLEVVSGTVVLEVELEVLLVDVLVLPPPQAANSNKTMNIRVLRSHWFILSATCFDLIALILCKHFDHRATLPSKQA
jgi:hypothetical protein